MRRAFTLLELLVVVAIIALLASLLLPALGRARAQGRRAVCQSNLHQLAVATAMYLDGNRDRFWRYYSSASGGRAWWFGYEPGGPGSGPNRPLDKGRGVLAKYLRSTDDDLQCPSFPYTSGCYFPKFAARSASYGYNLVLGPVSGPTKRRADYLKRSSSVFVFADGAHFDFNPGMNEGHYIAYDPYIERSFGGGYAHFRHAGRAMVLFLDGHVEGQRLVGEPFSRVVCGGLAGNLHGPGDGHGIYGR